MTAFGSILVLGAFVSALSAETFAQTQPRTHSLTASAAHKEMVWIAGGTFLMGSQDAMAKPNERPVHQVRVHGFWIDRTPVTNVQFARFVAATGYITTAERKPEWADLQAQLPEGSRKPPDELLVPGALVFVGSRHAVSLDDPSQWWRYVAGATWRHPQGPRSSIAAKAHHPVVQVSYDDALAYAQWAHKRLPTEAEWEFAARGGLSGALYAWGNELRPAGRRMANTWDESLEKFPVIKHSQTHGTTPVCSFPANGFGLCDVAGNVWQWVADWYRADAYSLSDTTREQVDPIGPSQSIGRDDPETPGSTPGAMRVIRGGSYACSQNYCQSYRPSSRRGADPGGSMSHIGFRLAKD